MLTAPQPSQISIEVPNSAYDDELSTNPGNYAVVDDMMPSISPDEKIYNLPHQAHMSVSEKTTSNNRTSSRNGMRAAAVIIALALLAVTIDIFILYSNGISPHIIRVHRLVFH